MTRARREKRRVNKLNAALERKRDGLTKTLEVYLFNKFCNRGAVIKTVLFRLKGEHSS